VLVDNGCGCRGGIERVLRYDDKQLRLGRDFGFSELADGHGQREREWDVFF